MTTTIKEQNKINKNIIPYKQTTGGQCFIIVKNNKDTIYMNFKGHRGFIRLEDGVIFDLEERQDGGMPPDDIEPNDLCTLVDIEILWKYKYDNNKI